MSIWLQEARLTAMSSIAEKELLAKEEGVKRKPWIRKNKRDLTLVEQ